MKDIQDNIAGLRDQGYEIRFPGGNGTFKNNTHASFGVVVKETKGKFFALVIPYKTDREDGSAKILFNESPTMTLVRKVKEETGVIIDIHLAEFIAELKVRDNRSNLKKNKKHIHIKRAFLSKLFDDQKIRRHEIRGSHLGIPFWIPVDILEEHIAPTHSWIVTFMKGIKEFKLVPTKKLSFFQRFLKLNIFRS